MYSEMTRGQQRKERTRVVAFWINQKHTFALVNLPRKVANRDGWHWTSDWCWKDCEGNLKPIDEDLLYSYLDITVVNSYPHLAKNLIANGYDIMDLDDVIVLNPKKYNK